MSAAQKLARIALDHYPTPPEVVQAILPFLPVSGPVLDPCCGGGDILEHFAAPGYGIEIDPGRAALASGRGHRVAVGDALQMSWPSIDLLVMNVPFTHALEFARKAMEWRALRRTVAMLARLTFLESAERAGFHREFPSDVYVLSRRPRFRGDTNGTDSVTAAWFVWGPGRGGRWSVL